MFTNFRVGRRAYDERKTVRVNTLASNSVDERNNNNIRTKRANISRPVRTRGVYK